MCDEILFPSTTQFLLDQILAKMVGFTVDVVFYCLNYLEFLFLDDPEIILQCFCLSFSLFWKPIRYHCKRPQFTADTCQACAAQKETGLSLSLPRRPGRPEVRHQPALGLASGRSKVTSGPVRGAVGWPVSDIFRGFSFISHRRDVLWGVCFYV